MSRFDRLPRQQRALLLAGLTSGLLALLLLLAEGTVRLRQHIKHGSATPADETYVVDESGLRVPRPGLTGKRININSHGFRSPEITVENTLLAVRLAFIGASTTYCAEVSGDEATWPHLVWKNLSEASPGKRYEYINAGVPGYAVHHSTSGLLSRVQQFRPDVIIVYHATNDLSANTFSLAKKQGVVQARTDQSVSWLSRRSLLSYLIEKNLTIWLAQRRSNSQIGKVELVLDEVVAPFKQDLRELLTQAKTVAPLVMVATFSTRIRRSQNDAQRREAAVTSLYYMPYMTLDGLLDGFDGYNHAIRDTAKDLGIPVIEVADRIPGDAHHFVDSVHFSDAGSRRMADLVSSRLLDLAPFQGLHK